jgi:hypothetical protein
MARKPAIIRDAVNRKLLPSNCQCLKLGSGIEPENG